MHKKPPIQELEFLKLCKNYSEMGSALTRMGLTAPDLLEYARHVCSCWFSLSEEHLNEANIALNGGAGRMAMSRAYYSVYNSSKAVRYVTYGYVSLRGDDHKAAGALPDDFPDVADWSLTVSTLYEHRLRADYDNWADTASLQHISPAEAVAKAQDFLAVVKAYMTTKYGVNL